jgi:ribonuclease HII
MEDSCMAWIIGIDEAGYGPNLGPFVMTSVACRVPDAEADRCLWRALSGAVRQGGDPADGRLLIDDSKVVFSQTRGLLDLERGVHAALGSGCNSQLHAWLRDLCTEGCQELSAEPWYSGDSALPAAAAVEELAGLSSRFDTACADAGVSGWRARCVVICAPRFNSFLDDCGTKGAVLAHALGSLLRTAEAEAADAEAAHFFVDKHGGRNAYAAFIQHALPRGAVLATEEGMARSVYRVHGLGRLLQLTFQPRADAAHFCVALASMASKYVRELCMAEFNRFWLERVPGLRRTAGYPGDAARFWEAIRPAAEKMGLSASQVWRRK